MSVSFSRRPAAFCLVLAVLSAPLFARGSGEAGVSAVDSYYLGRVEESAAAFGGSRAGKKQLVALCYELGEMARAAELLEELLAEADSEEGRAALSKELFYTYCLAGNHRKASALRRQAESAALKGDRRTQGEFYFYSGWNLEALGSAERAAEHYRRSVDLDRWRSVAWYRLGLLLREKNPKEAEKCFQTCWDQNSAFTETLLPLAKCMMDRGAWVEARNLLIIANSRLPRNREISEALAETRRHAPGSPGGALFLVERAITKTPPAVKAAPASRGGLIRVGLAEQRTVVSVKAGGAFSLRNAAGRASLYNGSAREQILVRWAGGDLRVFDRNMKQLLRSSAPLVLELAGDGDTCIVVGVVNGAPGTTRTYRGALEFRSFREGMTVVNVLPVEDYLYGCVPVEMPASWPAEALKVQAIAARSYAIAQKGQFAAKGFDIYGTPLSQAYHGVDGEHRSASAAVDATRNMVLKTGKDVLRAYYSANHGGYSENSITLWGWDDNMDAVPDKMLPFREKPLPPDELYAWIRDAPASYSIMPRLSFAGSYRWEKWVTPSEIRRRLGEDPGEIKRIVSRGRGISGRVSELEVIGSARSVFVRAEAIWPAMGGLRSSLFAIRYQLDARGNIEHVIFSGAGHGHGMGMDQHGAAGMAGAGYSAEQILRHYYPRAEIGLL
ncbi:MAG: SpoIID/LytB domain-containing protein [Treponema sp.]|jgi:peptidoglycan hydrolase-like amidase/tetratricopeptide (TPR) repeat protein|nr:SpoIID/LytB domain-containing protein [Treponema sp.]